MKDKTNIYTTIIDYFLGNLSQMLLARTWQFIFLVRTERRGNIKMVYLVCFCHDDRMDEDRVHNIMKKQSLK